MIDISLALLLFAVTGKHAEAAKWLEELSGALTYTYSSGTNFPIGTDSLDDLIELKADNSEKNRQKLKAVSTLVPTIAQWLIVFDLKTIYANLVRNKKVFEGTCMQLWYPDEATDEHLYMGPAQYNSGTSEAPIELSDNMDEFINRIATLVKSDGFSKISSMSYTKSGIPILNMIASRHFRTPMFPEYWQNPISVKMTTKLADAENLASTNSYLSG